MKAEISRLKEAYGQNKINPNQYQESLIEVKSLRKLLTATEKEKAEVQEEWKKKLEQSEKRKAEEISELKVNLVYHFRLKNKFCSKSGPELNHYIMYSEIYLSQDQIGNMLSVDEMMFLRI